MMQVPRRRRVGVVAVLVTAVASFSLAGPSGAQGGMSVTFPAGLFQGEELAAVATLSLFCEGQITADEVTFEFNGEPTELVTVGDFTAASFSFVIPAALTTEPAPATTSLLVSVTCDVVGPPVTQSATISWAQVEVTKTVIGDGPFGARFPMLVACESTMGDRGGFEFDLAHGEAWSLFAVTQGSCSVEELDGLGATATAIRPSGDVTLTSSSLFPVEVVNTFPQSPPIPGPPPEPPPAPTPVVGPAFTG